MNIFNFSILLQLLFNFTVISSSCIPLNRVLPFLSHYFFSLKKIRRTRERRVTEEVEEEEVRTERTKKRLEMKGSNERV
jgi:hypothetical protein